MFFKWKTILNYSRLAIMTLIVRTYAAVLECHSLASVWANPIPSLENAAPLVSVLNAWTTWTVVDLTGFVTRIEFTI